METRGAARLDLAFVCTGNRFRSPIAAAAFRAAVEGVPVQVTSYGTLDLGPVEPLPAAVREAHALGLDISSHVARSLREGDLRETSLVLGFEREHVVAAIEVAGAPVERAFMLAELIDLLDRIEVACGPDPLAQAAENLARARACRRAERSRRSVSEIADPVALPEAAQHAIAQAVARGAEALARRLFGTRDGARGR
jgi:protein-tyrosine-phosphatase